MARRLYVHSDRQSSKLSRAMLETDDETEAVDWLVDLDHC
jgi:hypothetical protein